MFLESERFREMAAATESPPKGGFRFDDDTEFPPVTQKTEWSKTLILMVCIPYPVNAFMICTVLLAKSRWNGYFTVKLYETRICVPHHLEIIFQFSLFVGAQMFFKHYINLERLVKVFVKCSKSWQDICFWINIETLPLCKGTVQGIIFCFVPASVTESEHLCCKYYWNSLSRTVLSVVMFNCIFCCNKPWQMVSHIQYSGKVMPLCANTVNIFMIQEYGF